MSTGTSDVDQAAATRSPLNEGSRVKPRPVFVEPPPLNGRETLKIGLEYRKRPAFGTKSSLLGSRRQEDLAQLQRSVSRVVDDFIDSSKRLRWREDRDHLFRGPIFGGNPDGARSFKLTQRRDENVGQLIGKFHHRRELQTPPRLRDPEMREDVRKPFWTMREGYEQQPAFRTRGELMQARKRSIRDGLAAAYPNLDLQPPGPFSSTPVGSTISMGSRPIQSSCCSNRARMLTASPARAASGFAAMLSREPTEAGRRATAILTPFVGTLSETPASSRSRTFTASHARDR